MIVIKTTKNSKAASDFLSCVAGLILNDTDDNLSWRRTAKKRERNPTTALLNTIMRQHVGTGAPELQLTACAL